jgi:hypothetical protein
VVTQLDRPTRRTGDPVAWALTSGVAGVVANVLLVLFFALARPWSGGPQQHSWLGTANDVVIVVQFLTLIGVAVGLRGWLPRTRAVTVATAAGVAAMLAVALLQGLLVLGLVEFELQVLLVTAAFLPVYGWVLVVSSVGHRGGSLPRTVTRFGLLLGVSFPVALLLTAAGLLLGPASPVPYLFAVPGLMLGALGWLALPLWPLALARLVFSRSAPVLEKGAS